ncbi:DUF1549 domain-containing protein [Anatilimnocola floriformis]|uniref:DUF1549 domain-containing protein n=1 Tax=Anatilimnocola floriformis TaxID=2948575 RepID=UPI0020C2B7EB|nr:DUF1549 domain-containing protein [Anatilimnocola floriformis]
MPRCCWLLSWMLLAATAASSAVSAADIAPLHQRIDQLFDQNAVGPVAEVCSDADFVRRVWLDLAGMIPTAEETRTFLADHDAAKRQKMIDRLLASPQFSRHMTLLLDATINERRPDKGITTADWQGYLYQAVSAGKPLDQLFRDIIAADGVEEKQRPAAKFMLDRDCEPNVVTRDVGRLVFGMDLQCAQCHDHPLVDDYLQADYYGLYALVMRSSVFADPKNKNSRQVGETADGEASFKSVFTGNTGDKVQPRTPKWLGLVEPVAKKGEEYVSKPTRDVRGVPKLSRRQLLADSFETSLIFRRNLANRIWYQVMGRGLVHPVDAHHPANPPANPQVLSLLAAELPELKYDLRAMLREILLTNAYQRSCELAAPQNPDIAAIDAELQQLETTRGSLVMTRDQQKAKWDEALAKLKESKQKLADAAKTLAPLQTALTAAQGEVTKAQAAVKTAEAEVEKKKPQTAAVAEAAAKAKAAAELIKEDKALAEIAAKLGEKAATVADAEKATAKKLEALAAAVSPLTAKEKEAQTALDQEAAAFPPPTQIVELESAERTANLEFNNGLYDLADLEARVTLTKLLKQHAELQKTDAAGAERLWNQLREELSNRGQVALLKPLSAEQFALSTMQAAGLIAVQQTTAETSVAKVEEWKNASDADKPAVMRKLSEPKVFDGLKGNLAEFVRLYGGLPGQDYQATVNQALFFGNGSVLETWLKPTPGNLVTRLQAKTEPAETADEMYHAILNRPATAEEQTAVTDFLKDRTDRPVAIAELVWALLASAEFRFNH